MLPNHPNLLLETALADLSEKLLSEQHTAFKTFKQQYEQDNHSLNNLATSLNTAIDELKTVSQNDLSNVNSNNPISSEQLDSLLTHNQQLAEQVEQLANQYQEQHSKHQSQIHLLVEGVANLNQHTQSLVSQNQQLHQQNQALQQSNQQLQTDNQALLDKLDGWIALYQVQNSKISDLMTRLNLLPADKLSTLNNNDRPS